MRYSAAAAQQWQQAADGSRAFYAAAASAAACTADASDDSPPKSSNLLDTPTACDSSTGPVSAARLAHVAAAQLLAMGYECGLYDLLGCVAVAEQVLTTVAQMLH